MNPQFVYASISMMLERKEKLIIRGISQLLENAATHQFVFYEDESMTKIIEPTIEELGDYIGIDFYVTFYVRVKRHPIKIVIDIKKEGEFVYFYPLEPYLTKKGYGSEEQKCDFGFYIEQILYFCDHFFIYELYTR
ncbi:MAG: hypothetical protein WCD44_02940 [Candidatus Babeliales bacterium]|jgi:hypothetical protein